MTSFELNMKAFLMMEAFISKHPNWYYGFRTRANNGRSIDNGDFFNGDGTWITIRLTNDADCVRGFSSICIYMDVEKNRILSISYNQSNAKAAIYDALANEISASLESKGSVTRYNIELDNNNWENTLLRVLEFVSQKDPSLLIDQATYNKGKIIAMNSVLLQTIISLEKNHNLILTGAPGTGKTYLAKEIAQKITGDLDDNHHPHYKMVQFHPSYDYSDFVEGLRPVKDATGHIGFERRDGVFKAFCKKALNDYNQAENKEESHKYVFIIDEINRGEMSKIFGELFFSIDPGYRGVKGKIDTQYQNLVDKDYDENDNEIGDDIFKDGFFVPENVYIIGTMNDIDRSVESMDFAMRRRFTFKEVKATDRIDMWDNNIDQWKDEAEKKMNAINAVIEQIPGLNEAYHIGPSYFLKIKDLNGDWSELWNSNLKGLVAEYLRGMPDARERLHEVEDAYKNN